MKRNLRGSLFLLAAALVWGMAFAAQSAAMDDVGPFTFNAARSILAAAALGLILWIKPDFGRTEAEEPASFKSYLKIGGGMGIIMFLASSLQQLGLFYGATAGKSGFITALYIIIVPLMGVFLGKRLRAVTWVGVAISLVGMALLCIKDGDLSIGPGEWLTLGCAVAFAVHIIVIDRFAASHNAVKLCCMQFAVSGALCTISALIFETPRLDALWACLPAILYVGIGSGAIGYTFQMLGQKDTEPTVASLIMCLESVFAAVGGWLLLHEVMSLREIIGCAMMLAASAITQVKGDG